MEQTEKAFVIEIENAIIKIEMQGGFFDFGFGDKFRVHNHGDFEFHMAIQGKSEFLTESGRYTIADSDILIVEPYTIHSCVDGIEKTVKMSFCFSVARLNKKTENDIYSFLIRAFETVKGIKMLHGKKYGEIVRNILFEFHSKNSLSEVRLKAYFLLLVTGLARDMEPETHALPMKAEARKNGKEQGLYRIMIEEYINYNYNKEISLGHLAKALHLCEKQTSRIIQKEFGMSFREFVSKIRCRAAVFLLTNTDTAITEIAEKVGYSTYNGFYSMFVSCMGMSPEQYRLKIKKL